MMPKVARQRRHVVTNGLCWCGSTHDWTLAKHGYCACMKPDCLEVHRS